MKLSHEHHDHMTVIAVQGEISADELSPLKRLLDERLEEDARDFVIDVAEVPFIDSVGLETLLWLQDQVGEKLGQVRLVGVGKDFHKVLEITRLQNDFEAHDDLDSAIRSLR